MGEFNLEKYLSVERMKMLEDQKRYKEMIEELEQTNHEIIEKNKALLEENKNLRWQYEQYQVEEDKLMEEIEALRKENEKLKWAESKRASWEQAFHKMFLKVLTLQNKLETLKEENKANKDILFYQEQNRKLMESNKSLVEEIEKLKKRKSVISKRK